MASARQRSETGCSGRRRRGRSRAVLRRVPLLICWYPCAIINISWKRNMGIFLPSILRTRLFMTRHGTARLCGRGGFIWTRSGERWRRGHTISFSISGRGRRPAWTGCSADSVSRWLPMWRKMVIWVLSAMMRRRMPCLLPASLPWTVCLWRD